MGLVDRLKSAFSADEEGVKYQCTSCGTEFETARDRCPQCGEDEVRERGSFEFRPDQNQPR